MYNPTVMPHSIQATRTMLHDKVTKYTVEYLNTTGSYQFELAFYLSAPNYNNTMSPYEFRIIFIQMPANTLFSIKRL